MIFAIGAACLAIKNKYKDQALQVTSLSEVTSKLALDPKDSRMELLVITEEVLRNLGSNQFIEAVPNKHKDVHILYLYTKHPKNIAGMVSMKVQDFKASSTLPLIESHLIKIVTAKETGVDTIEDGLVGKSEEESYDIDGLEKPKKIQRVDIGDKSIDGPNLPNKSKFVLGSESSKKSQDVFSGIKKTLEGKAEDLSIVAAPKLLDLKDRADEAKQALSNIRVEFVKPEVEEKAVTGDTIQDKSSYARGNFEPLLTKKPEKQTPVNINFAGHVYAEGQGHKAVSEVVDLKASNTSISKGSAGVALESAIADSFKSSTIIKAGAGSKVNIKESSSQEIGRWHNKFKDVSFDSGKSKESQIASILLQEVEGEVSAPISAPKEALLLDIISGSKNDKTPVKTLIKLDEAEGAKVVAVPKTEAESMLFSINSSLREKGVQVPFETMNLEDVQAIQNMGEEVQYLKIALPELQSGKFRQAVNRVEVNMEKAAAPTLADSSLPYQQLEVFFNEQLRNFGYSATIYDLTDEELARIPQETWQVDPKYMDIVLPVMKIRKANEQAIEFLSAENPEITVSSDKVYENIAISVNEALRRVDPTLRIERMTKEDLDRLGNVELPISKEVLELVLPEIRYREIQRKVVNFIPLTEEELANLNENDLAMATEYGRLTVAVNNALLSQGLFLKLEDMTKEDLDRISPEILPVSKDYLEMLLPELQEQMRIVRDLKKAAAPLRVPMLALSKEEIAALTEDRYVEATHYASQVFEINQLMRERGLDVSFENLSDDDLPNVPIMDRTPEELSIILHGVQREIYLAKVVNFLPMSPEEISRLEPEALVYATKYNDIAIHVNNALRAHGIDVSFENLSNDELENLDASIIPYDKAYLLSIIEDVRENVKLVNMVKVEFQNVLNSDLTDEEVRVIHIMNEILTKSGYPIAFENMSSSQVQSLPDEGLPYTKEYLQSVLETLHERRTRLEVLNSNDWINNRERYEELKSKANNDFSKTHSSAVQLTDLSADDLRNMNPKVLPATAEYLILILPELKRMTRETSSLLFQNKIASKLGNRALEYMDVVFGMNQSLAQLGVEKKFEQLSQEELLELPEDKLFLDMNYLQLALSEIQYLITKSQVVFYEVEKGPMYHTLTTEDYTEFKVKATASSSKFARSLTAQSLTNLISPFFVSIPENVFGILQQSLDFSVLEALLYYGYLSDELLNSLELSEEFSSCPCLMGFNESQRKIIQYSLYPEHRFKVLMHGYVESSIGLNEEQSQSLLERCMFDSYTIQLSTNQREVLYSALDNTPELADMIEYENEGVPEIESSYSVEDILYNYGLQEDFIGCIRYNLSEDEKYALVYSMLYPDDLFFNAVELPDFITDHPQIRELSPATKFLIFSALTMESRLALFANSEVCASMGYSGNDIYQYIQNLPAPYDNKIPIPALSSDRYALIRKYVR